ncbi:MAG: TonB-dependent receptor family protein [Bacteroidota bacterium]
MKNFRFLISAILFVVFLLPDLLHAQEESFPDSLSLLLEPIQIEAAHSSVTMDRATMSVSTLRRSLDDVVSRRASTLDELTFTLPGIWVSNRENHALGERMTIRGMGWRSQFGVRGVQVVLDDIPLTVADGQTIMNMVDPAMIQSIELLRGPSATLWGNSSGGVLYMKTRPGPNHPSLFLRSYGGSHGTMKHEARIHEQAGPVRLDAYGSYFDTDGYRDYSAAELWRGGLAATVQPDRYTSVTGRLAYAGMPFAQHPGSLGAQDAEQEPTKAWPFNVNMGAGKEYEQWMGSLQMLREFSPGVLTVTGHGALRDLENPLPGPYIMVDRRAGGSRATWAFTEIPFDLQVGAELKWQRDERSQTDNNGGTPDPALYISQLDRVSNQALFAKSVFDLESVSISAGLRADRMAFQSDSLDVATGEVIPYPEEDRIFTTVNPSLGLIWKLDRSRLFANVSTSFESPTTTEFKNRLSPDGVTILPGFNADLDPERTVGAETGIRGWISEQNLEYDLTFFTQFVRDQIIQETEIDGQAIFSNGGTARHLGLEAAIAYQPANWMSARGMISWTDAQFTGDELEAPFKGNQLPGVAPLRAGLALEWFANEHTLGLDIEHVGSYYADSANSAENDAFTLLHSRWTFSGIGSSGWTLQPFVSVQNLLDTRYNTSVALNNGFGRFYEPGAGRSFQAGLSLQI